MEKAKSAITKTKTRWKTERYEERNECKFGKRCGIRLFQDTVPAFR